MTEVHGEHWLSCDRGFRSEHGCRVRSSDGALIRDLRTSYQLAGPDPWRIVSYVNHDVVTDRPVVD